MDLSAFRVAFPEFASTVTYPDATLTFWSALGEKLLKVWRWADFYDEGIMIYTAHQVTIATKNLSTPGQASGITSSKSVGDVSVSYDTQAGIEKEAGHWNLTTYGRQFIQLARIVGSGGKQL